MRESIPIEIKIAMALAQLGSGDHLQMYEEVYGIVKRTSSIIAKELYLVIKEHLKPLENPKLTRNKIKVTTTSSKSLHWILYILSAINGSHISILAT
jgi:hypothetical protein